MTYTNVRRYASIKKGFVDSFPPNALFFGFGEASYRLGASAQEWVNSPQGRAAKETAAIATSLALYGVASVLRMIADELDPTQHETAPLDEGLEPETTATTEVQPTEEPETSGKTQVVLGDIEVSEVYHSRRSLLKLAKKVGVPGYSRMNTQTLAQVLNVRYQPKKQRSGGAK